MYDLSDQVLIDETGYKNHLAINDERLITGIEVTTGRAADTKILEELVEQSQRNGMRSQKYLETKPIPVKTISTIAMRMI